MRRPHPLRQAAGRRMSPRRSLVFLVALVVVASVAATAHGLYAVAVTSGVPFQVAYLYPLITDGLALVAYWATKQLDSARYPWMVIVVAAGLSGLAQAVNLAGLGSSPTWLRFGVGYWPAVAVLFAAHLLWLVGRPRGLVAVGSVEMVREEVTSADGSDVPGPDSDPPAPDLAPLPIVADSNGTPANGHATTKLAKAKAALEAYEAERERRPTQRELAALAGVHQSTARDALALTKGSST